MGSTLRTLRLLATLLAGPAAVHAQAVVTGTVTDPQGLPLDLAYLSIESLRVTTWTTEDGTYRIEVPDALLRDLTTTVSLRVQHIGHRTEEVVLRLERGQTLVQDFSLAVDPLRLDEIVVTGQGLQAQRRRVGSTINTVRSEELTGSYEPNVVNALAAKAPNVEVTSTSGDPGVGSYIRIRGSRSIVGGSQPLFVVDGTPISNASDRIVGDPASVDEGTYAGPGSQNRAVDLNPNDVESIEILKGPAAASVYGSRAANGVVLITTKSGRRNTTRATFSTSLSVDRVTQLPELQTRFGQGLDQSVIGGSGVRLSSVSWGTELDPETPVYDHAGELFETGLRSDNSLILSGGTDRTTYFLSLGYLHHDGTIRGRSAYERVSARLNASHDFLDRLTVRGSLAYTTSRGHVLNQGSDLSGMLLGALRTPPEFDNLPYRDPDTGLHRSYICETLLGPSCLTSPSASRGFDNPFWVTHEVENDSEVDRTFGNATTDYAPIPWLRLRHILGFDVSSDRRFSLWPQSSSGSPTGYVQFTEYVRKQFDHSLLATVTHTAGPDADLELVLGQNLNQETFRTEWAEGRGLIENARRVDFATDHRASQFESTVRTTGYFGRASARLWGELSLSAGLRYDGSSTFGGDVDPETGKREPSWFWYPELSASWEFGRRLDWLQLGRVRMARGESGTQPPPYSNVGGFESSWAYQTVERVGSPTTLPNTDIKPERTVEWEVGGDVALWDSRLSVGVTRYWQKTTDAILAVPLPPQTGYESTLANGASWRNWGWEITLEARPVVRRDFSWTLGVNWARNRSMVDELLGTESVRLRGFDVVYPAVVEGHPFGVLRGSDFVRFGRGLLVDDVDIDATYGAEPGTLYIGADGFPILDQQVRVIGDPNPDWTASVHSTFSLWGAVQVSALVDIKKGGDMWNGTKGALYSYGTHKGTEPMHGLGVDTVFAGAGPGAGKTVPLNWDTWGLGLGGGLWGGPSSQFVEDAGYVKLREVTLSFTLGPEWLSRMGFAGLDVSVGGRNLATWTDYTGIDPESNLTGQSTGRGLEYFNHPQTRSLVFGLTLRR